MPLESKSWRKPGERLASQCSAALVCGFLTNRCLDCGIPTEVAHILSISYDAELLKTRKLLLEYRGHNVTSAEGFAEAFRICGDPNTNFDLIVLGHSIPHQDKRAMIQHCVHIYSCPVLALLRENEPPVEEATRSVPPDPSTLLGAVQEILSEAPSLR